MKYVKKKKLALFRYVFGKGRSVLLLFSCDCGHSSSNDTETQQVDSYRFVALWSLKPHQRTFHVLLHQNTVLCAFNGFCFLPTHDFVTIRISHLENIGSLNNADLPNVDIFHYPVSKITHSLISLPITSKKSLSIGKLSSIQWQTHVFQNSNFCLKPQISLGTITVSCVLGSNRLTSSIFKDMSFQYPSLKDHCLLVSSSLQHQRCYMKGTTKSIYGSNSCIIILP